MNGRIRTTGDTSTTCVAATRRWMPRSFSACEMLPEQSDKTRWICSRSTRAREGAGRSVLHGAVLVQVPVRRQYLLCISGLTQIMVRSELQSLQRRRDTSVTGQNNYRNCGIQFLNALDQDSNNNRPPSVLSKQMSHPCYRDSAVNCRRGHKQRIALRCL